MEVLPVVYILIWVVYYMQGQGVAADAECTNGAKSPSMTLKKQLFCSYDPSVRPVKAHTNITDVKVHLWLKFLIFNEHLNTLEVHNWMVWKWKDEHLTWDKNENSGLDKLHVTSSEIWVPDVAIYNAGNLNYVSTQISETRCLVENDGQVLCVSPTVYEAQCIPDITRWPYDTHNCTMRMGSWTHSGNQLNITLDGRGVSAMEYAKNKEWELIDGNATRQETSFDNVTYPWINFSFEMKRHPGGHASTVVIPSLVLALATLTTFWLEADGVQRLSLICTNIVCHCLYMLYLGVMLPANGDKTPYIVTFFRDSFLLAGMSLLVYICARRMNAAARAPPAWVSSITDGVLAFSPGQLLLLGELDPKGVAAARGLGVADDSAELVGASSAASGWRLFSTLLDRVCFLVFTLTLFILLCAFIP